MEITYSPSPVQVEGEYPKVIDSTPSHSPLPKQDQPLPPSPQTGPGGTPSLSNPTYVRHRRYASSVHAGGLSCYFDVVTYFEFLTFINSGRAKH